MPLNSSRLPSGENSYINTLIMELLNTSLKKENDEHNIFGAYVAMEMRNLKTSDEQKKLRAEIRDAISRVENLENIKYYVNNQKKLDDSKNNPTVTSPSNIEVANVCHEQLKTKKDSWELI